MSLINDALRRAGEESRRRSRPSSPFRALQPVDRLDRGGAGLKWLGFFLLLSFGTAVWFLYRSGQPAPEPEPVRMSAATPAAAPLQPPATIQAGPPPSPPAPALSEPSEIRVSTNLLVRTSGAPSAAPATHRATTASDRASKEGAEPAQPFPAVRLQSIIFRPDQPMAMINGQTVVPGDEVDGLRVAEIRRTSVILAREDERHEFWLRDF
jgi:hypothetical protein